MKKERQKAKEQLKKGQGKTAASISNQMKYSSDEEEEVKVKPESK